MKELIDISTVWWYRISVLIVSFLIIVPAIIDFKEAPFILKLVQIPFVIAIVVAMIIFPKRESEKTRFWIGILFTVYIYMLHISYPDTAMGLLLCAITPVLAIVFFNKKLFYVTIGINAILTAYMILEYLVFEQKYFYSLEEQYWSNILNFVVSQVILWYAFQVAQTRILKIKQYYEKIQQTERLHSVGQMAAAFAHEIRNPLTVVKGFLQLSQQDDSLTKEKMQHTGIMLQEIDRAEKVIQDFLTLGKPKKDEEQIMEISEQLYAVKNLLSSFAAYHNCEIVIREEVKAHVSFVEVEFLQVLINLIKNAVEAMPEGGTVYLSNKVIKNKILVSVRDTGKGMTEEELKLIGTPFYSLKSTGTGLGLAVCYSLLHARNANLYFESVKGEGTAANIELLLSKTSLQKKELV